MLGTARRVCFGVASVARGCCVPRCPRRVIEPYACRGLARCVFAARVTPTSPPASASLQYVVDSLRAKVSARDINVFVLPCKTPIESPM